MAEIKNVRGQRTPMPTLFEPKTADMILIGLFGIMILLPVAWLGTYAGLMMFSGSALLAYVVGFSCIMFCFGVLGFFTVIVRQAVQEVVIKVVEEKEE